MEHRSRSLHRALPFDRICGTKAVEDSSTTGSRMGTPPDAEGLVERNILTAQALEFLTVCFDARLNTAISGAEGSGKRTLLHAMVSYLAGDGQILAVQNPDEPSLEREGITVLKAHADPDDAGPGISRHYLLSLVPKMHATGLVLDRVEGDEAVLLLRLLFAMNGVLFSVVADSPQDALLKLEELGVAHGEGLDSGLAKRMLACGLDLIVQLGKGPDGFPAVLSLTEVAEAQNEDQLLREIFVRVDLEPGEATKSDARWQSPLRPTGIKPLFLDRLESLGISVPDHLFA
jgi:pilus assembly protein CpaF